MAPRGEKGRRGVTDRHLLSGPEDAARAFGALSRVPAVALPGLDSAGCELARAATADLSFRKARPVVGNGPRPVHQDFEICSAVPSDNPLWRLGQALSALFDAGLAAMPGNGPPPVDQAGFNDLVVQAYPAGSTGILPHRDHIRYTGLVVLVIVDDGGRFAVCDDRSGNGAETVAAGAGDLLVMRGAGFGGRRERPFHFLEAVETPRLSIGYRHDSRAP